jgi:hypothetical protein
MVELTNGNFEPSYAECALGFKFTFETMINQILYLKGFITYIFRGKGTFPIYLQS